MKKEEKIEHEATEAEQEQGYENEDEEIAVDISETGKISGEAIGLKLITKKKAKKYQPNTC